MDDGKNVADSTIDSGHPTNSNFTAHEGDAAAATSTPRAMPLANSNLPDAISDKISQLELNGKGSTPDGVEFSPPPGYVSVSTSRSNSSCDVSAMFAASGFLPVVFRCPDCSLELPISRMEENSNFNLGMFHASKSPQCKFVKMCINTEKKINLDEDSGITDSTPNVVAGGLVVKDMEWRLAGELSRAAARDANDVAEDVSETPLASLQNQVKSLEGKFRSLDENKVDKEHYVQSYNSLNGKIDEGSLQRDQMREDINQNKADGKQTKNNCKAICHRIRKGEKERKELKECQDRTDTRLGALSDVATHHSQQLADVKQNVEDVRVGLENVAVNNVADSEPRMDLAGNPVDPINAADDGEDGVEVEGVDAEQEWQQ